MAVTYCPSCGEWIGQDGWYTYSESGGASCTSGGTVYRTYYYECSNCGWDTTESESYYESALGHSWGSWSYIYTDWITTLEPTCVTEGQQSRTKNSSRTCSRCSTKETGTSTTEYGTIPVIAHDFIFDHTETSLTESFDVYKCTMCNAVDYRNYINPEVASFPYAVKINGKWVSALPYIKFNGAWVALSRCYEKHNGEWK